MAKPDFDIQSIIIPFSMVDNNLHFAPTKATEHSSCYKIRCTHRVELDPNKRTIIKTGIKLNMPIITNLYENTKINNRISSSVIQAMLMTDYDLGLKHGFVILSPSILPSDFNQEICLLGANLGEKTFVREAGDLIAQLVFSVAPRVVINIQ